MSDAADNVYDFIEIKMIHMAEEYASRGREDIAATMYAALDEYIAGRLDIIFHAGMPYLQRPETIAVSLDPSAGEIEPED
tara:strand:+ start:314 stop:553 length:240 start_codon:yes stop_codon:yes gene_type:complete